MKALSKKQILYTWACPDCSYDQGVALDESDFDKDGETLVECEHCGQEILVLKSEDED